MAITIKFYGAFKKYGDKINLDVPDNQELTVTSIRSLIKVRIKTDNPDALSSLLEVSAFADESDILPSEAKIKDLATLSLLPPVCGG